MKKNILFIISLFIFFTLLIIYFIISINNSRVKFVNEKDNELEISIKYPSFKYRKLNKRIKYIINKYSREIKNTPFDDNYHIYTLYIDYKEYKYKDYISLVFYSELFLGGAHPNHYIDTVIYNTKNNSFININDLINIDKNIRTILQLINNCDDYQIKFVVRPDETDFEEVKKYVNCMNLQDSYLDKVMVMPLSNSKNELEDVQADVVRLSIKYNFRYADRLQLHIWDNEEEK